MAERDQKTFEPTPQRLRKAREEGNVLRSRELVALGMLSSGMTILFMGTPLAFHSLQELMRDLFYRAPSFTLTIETTSSLLEEITVRLLQILLPFFLVSGTLAVGLNIVQSGWNVAVKSIVPKLSRISPLEGFKRIFSSKGLFELLKGLLKLALLIPIAYLTISNHWQELLTLPFHPLPDIWTQGSRWIFIMIAQMLGVLALLVGADFAFQKWKYYQDLKMSFQELKDEIRESEGDPQLKVRRKQLAAKMARRPRLDHAVLKADVVITNPTHYAVALRYDPDEGDAPRVLVKGIRKRALRIRALAMEHGIPVIEEPPLARALYYSVDEEQEIPPELYPAVATILAEIYRQRGMN